MPNDRDLLDEIGKFDPREDVGREANGSRVTLEEAERKMIVEVLEKTGWNKTKAAKRLDIPRMTTKVSGGHGNITRQCSPYAWRQLCTPAENQGKI